MNQNRINELITVYRDGLLKNTVPFWQKHAPDRTHGGFLTFLGADGSIVGTDKPVWVAGRVTWLFSVLYNEVEKRPEWLELATHGIRFLEKHCFDDDGRMYYTVTRDGRPLRKRRYLFSESFGVMAFAEYSMAAQDDAARKRAKAIFELMVRYYRTPGLLEPKLLPQTRQLKALSMPMVMLCISQVIRRVDDDPIYRREADSAIDEVRRHFLKSEYEALLENVGPNGEFLDEPMGRVVNPGHSIEMAWFMLHEARLRGDHEELLRDALQILDWSMKIGWDSQYGGIFYFRDCRGLPCEQYEHDMKLWWPHNEAIYATLLAHHITGDPKYERWHTMLHDWSYSHFPDRLNGEWFGYLHRDGSLSSSLKGNMWKGPFHLPRMELYCWKLLEEMKRS